MKQKTTKFLLVLVMMLSLCFLCTACGGAAKDTESTESGESTKSEETSTLSPENDPSEGLGDIIPEPDENTVTDFSAYEGVWLGDEDNSFEDIYIEFGLEGFWYLYISGNKVDEGSLVYDPGQEIIYADGNLDSTIDGGLVELNGDQLYISTLGYFTHLVSEDDTFDDYEENEDDNPDYEVSHMDVSAFEGAWYFDNDLSAELYIIIDDEGNWYYFERSPGDPEGTQMDCGTLSWNPNKSDAYYADSTMYNNLRFNMYDQGDGVILWDEDAYYRLE